MTTAILSLGALLETHELPFTIYDSDLRIVAVNKAWETMHGVARDEVFGRPCCQDACDCRHKKLLRNLEPYRETITEVDQLGSSLTYQVKGVPLIGYENKIYLSESKVLSAFALVETSPLVGRSQPFMECLSRMQQAASTELPVMVHGETGTGKELVAQFIHNNSNRKNESFVIVDCTVLNNELFESELFGHEKGAFTGANTQKKGLVEVANNGTLFLDEVGELPLALQAKLLRVLETGQYRRVGGNVALTTDVRVVSATHRNLSAMVQRGQFREDLFYRLSIFPINLPSLRDRPDDIPLLAIHFLYQFSKKTGKSFSLTPGGLKKLKSHHWPGNVRELKNCTFLASGLAQNGIIDESNIYFMQSVSSVRNLDSTENAEITMSNIPIVPPSFNIHDQEKEYISNLLSKHDNHRKACADEMNVTERTFYRKLKKYNLS